EARMTKVAIGLLVLGAFVLFVDNLHPLFANDIYCRIGAGELRQTRQPARPPAWGSWQIVPDESCLHGSVWDAIILTITGRQWKWKQDTLRDD
ncbi:MAG TPA: hypothetical protein VKF35_20285, partial [Hyphomicrobiaceae bacterium]|nr:hypothetical protein [Hyphomicrobiaceae bacterium]